MKHADRAEQYYSNNFNCSQAVFTTFATDLGLNEDIALKIATTFGGGARKGEMCGAVTGALMVLGLQYGHCHAGNTEEKYRAYQIAEDFMDRFIAAKGTVVCRKLLGYDLTKEEDMVKIKELNLFRTKCPEMVRCAAEIVEQMIAELQQPGELK